MIENECRFSCPNCGTGIVAQVPGRAKCAGPGCRYLFQIFSKRDRRGAEEFYLTQPSKKLKYLRRTEDDRWFVAFSEKSEPFIPENLFDLIDPKALQTIQVGLSERLERPMTIVVRFKERPKKEKGSEFPVEVIERNGRIFGRVDPVNPRAHYCKRCIEIRELTEGEEACLHYNLDITQEMIETGELNSIWMPCWTGLIDYAVPVVINDFFAAVFFTGQIRWTDPEGEQELVRCSEKVSEILPLTKEHLLCLADDKSQMKADKAQLDQLSMQYEDVVRTISDVAENRYWAERGVKESEFMTEVLISFAVIEGASLAMAESEELLWKVLEVVLQRLNEFSYFQYSAFLLNSEDSKSSFAVKAKAGFCPTEQELKMTREEADKIFDREALFPVKEAGQSRDNELYAKILNFLGVDDVNCAFLFPCRLGAIGKGLIILAERTEVIPGRRSTGRVSERKKEFLERVAHGIKIEIQSELTITEQRRTLLEKDDLMATAGHVLVAPLDSAYGKTEHLITLLDEGNPDTIVHNAAEMWDLCHSIDEDIVQSVHKARSFMFFTTMGTDAEEYRFDRQISLVELLEECTGDFRYLAKKRGITIELRYSPDDLPSANFDGDKLKMAFSNLLDNAVKYSHAKRVVGVNLSFDRSDNTYTISVSDFGVGIPASEYDKIFEQYYHSVLKDPRRFIPGTGIGLAVVKQIVTKHGGKIWVTSKQGPSATGTSSSVEGFNTTFWIQIHRKRRILE